MVIFILAGLNSMRAFAGIDTLDAGMIKRSNSLIFRRPRQFVGVPIADLAITHFVDVIAELLLEYYASMELRHGINDKAPVSLCSRTLLEVNRL